MRLAASGSTLYHFENERCQGHLHEWSDFEIELYVASLTCLALVEVRLMMDGAMDMLEAY